MLTLFLFNYFFSINYTKDCFKKSEVIYKTFNPSLFWRYLIHLTDAKKVWLRAKKFHGWDVESEKKWDCNLKKTEMICRDLILQQNCNKLFSLMDIFWVEISGKNINICCLVKVRGPLDNVEKEATRN